jgi:microcystin degradation protein MlrC
MHPHVYNTSKPAPMKHATPRVAILGFFIECNRWAPVSTQAMFEQSIDLAGEALGAELRSPTPRLLPDTLGFVAEMDRAGPWQPVSIRAAGAQPGGPVDQAYFDALLADMHERLQQALPLDAVFISSHGAAMSTGMEDPDGELFARIRAIVGPQTPVVAVLDLHANVSVRMTEALSGFVAYRTNPHNDLRARGEEAARLIQSFLREGPGGVSLVKLPLVPPATSQLIAPGTVYRELIESAQTYVAGEVLNVSLCGGFALADSPKCGFSVVVTTRQGYRARGEALARTLAGEVWAARHRFVSRLVPLAEAVSLAMDAGRDATRPPLILADVADNPGAGGGGNTVGLLQALIEAQVQGALLGVFTDAALAREAHALGVGADFEAVFNRTHDNASAGLPRQAPPPPPGVACLRRRARVLALSDGRFLGRRGLVAGTQRDMGPSALLDLDGLRVAVISHRQQLLDPAQLDVFGVDLSTVRTLLVKSRGHFRAAFEGWTSDERIVEVDCPGLTTPNLRTLPWQRLTRPVYPIDEDTVWPALVP